MQRIAGLDESSGHILDGFRVKSLTSTKGVIGMRTPNVR